MIEVVAQVLLYALLAPALQGMIKRLKARLQGRAGPGWFQPYADLAKLLRKGSVVPDASTWIFRVAPLVAFAATLAAAAIVPAMALGRGCSIGDVVVVAGLFALARFAMALASLDTGSTFAGMGASRDMAISALIEPALVLAALSMADLAGTTDLSGVAAADLSAGPLGLGPGHALAAVALLLVAIAETGRLPVDNPDTHLELTMAHEGMLLEHSGRGLALLTWAAEIKQMLILGVVIALVAPWGVDQPLPIALAAWLAKLAILGAILALIESIVAKLRILRLPELLATSFALGGLSIVASSVFGG